MGTFNLININDEFYQSSSISLAKKNNGNADFIEFGDTVIIGRKAQNENEYNLSPIHWYNPQPVNYSIEIIRENDSNFFFVQVEDNKITNIFTKDNDNCFNIKGVSIGTNQWEPEIKENKHWTMIRKMKTD